MAKQGPGMRMMGGSGGIPYMAQVQKLAPPIANTVEEVTSHKTDETRELSDEVNGLIGAFVEIESSQRPYSDVEILNYMVERGHSSLTRRDIAYARERLGIKPSSQRYSE